MPSVKHPKRDGENHFAVLKTTMNERLPLLRYLTSRDNVLVVPWMPWVGNLTNHRNVGVVLRGSRNWSDPLAGGIHTDEKVPAFTTYWLLATH